MKRNSILLAVAALALPYSFGNAEAEDKPMGAPIVFFDIAAPEMAKQKEFYSKVFHWDIAADGKFNVSVVSPLPGLLRVDPKDKLLYMGVPDINATLKDIEANGGKVDAPRFEVPGVVVLALFTDPAGNRMGLVEMEGDKARVPKAK